MRLSLEDLIDMEVALQEADRRRVDASGTLVGINTPLLTRTQIAAQLEVRFRNQREFSMRGAVTGARRRWK